MATSDDALQPRRSLSHGASRLVRLGPRVGIEPRRIGFKGGPIDEAGRMVLDENNPLFHEQMPRPLFNNTLFIDVTFEASFPVGVSASIHRMGQDLVECVVGGRHPADRTGHARWLGLQRERQTFGTEPEPDPSCRAEFGEALEDRTDGAGDGFIGMEENFTIPLSPEQTYRQSAPQFSASGLVADAAVETGAEDVQLGFTHRAL